MGINRSNEANTTSRDRISARATTTGTKAATTTTVATKAPMELVKAASVASDMELELDSQATGQALAATMTGRPGRALAPARIILLMALAGQYRSPE